MHAALPQCIASHASTSIMLMQQQLRPKKGLPSICNELKRVICTFYDGTYRTPPKLAQSRSRSQPRRHARPQEGSAGF